MTDKAGYEYVHTLRNHIIASEASSTLCIIIFIMASSRNKDWDADFCCDLAELMVSSEEEEVVSAGVPTELRNLASDIFKTNAHGEFVNLSPTEGHDWLKSHPKVSSKYENFLDLYGHRCLREVQ
jgi:hypothetical protein